MKVGVFFVYLGSTAHGIVMAATKKEQPECQKKNMKVVTPPCSKSTSTSSEVIAVGYVNRTVSTL